MTVEISTYHSLKSSTKSLKKRVELSKPGFELVSAKKTGFSQQSQVFDEAASPQPVENRPKPVKIHQNP